MKGSLWENERENECFFVKEKWGSKGCCCCCFGTAVAAALGCCCCFRLLLLLLLWAAAAALLQQKGKRERGFWGVWMERERESLSNEIVLFIPLLFITQSLPWKYDKCPSLTHHSTPTPYPINKAPCLPPSWSTSTPKYGEGYGGKVNNMWLYSFLYIHTCVYTY